MIKTTIDIETTSIHGTTGQRINEGTLGAGAIVKRVERISEDEVDLYVAQGAVFVERVDVDDARRAGVEVPELDLYS